MPVRNNRCFGEIAADKNSGKLKKADYDRIIQIAKEAIAREGKIRGLIIAEAFEGWERKEDWDDVSFMMEEGQHIEKMASSAMKNGATTRWHLPPKDFAPPPSSSGVTHE